MKYTVVDVLHSVSARYGLYPYNYDLLESEQYRIFTLCIDTNNIINCN